MLRRRCWTATIVVGLAVALSGCVRADVLNLAGDATDGRNNNTPGSTLAQNYLLDALTGLTEGANSAATGVDAYKQPFDQGTNLVGVIPGTDLADEYVMIGAHYDHVGHGCRDVRAGDDICNGATDNAASVAAVLQVVRSLVAAPQPPRRSVIVAFWDREEDGLVGSRVLHAAPADPARRHGRVRQPRHPGLEPAPEPAQLQLRGRRRERRHAFAADRAGRDRPRRRSGRASSASCSDKGAATT